MGALDESLGAVELGILVATMLYGMSLVQAYRYFSINNKSDTLAIKLMVVFLCVCETVHSCLIWAYLYRQTVIHFGDVHHITDLPWSFDVSLALSGLIGGTTQAFATYRVYRLSGGRLLLAIPAWTAALGRVAISFTLMTIILRGQTLYQIQTKYSGVVYASLSLSAALDLYNSAALCWYLRKAGGMGNGAEMNPSTKGAVWSIALWAVETGLATTTGAFLVLICWATMPGNGLWLCFFFVYSKMYSNSLLISLNAREKLRQAASGWRDTGSGGGLNHNIHHHPHSNFGTNSNKGNKITKTNNSINGNYSSHSASVVDGITITRTLDVATAPAPVVHLRPSKRYGDRNPNLMTGSRIHAPKLSDPLSPISPTSLDSPGEEIEMEKSKGSDLTTSMSTAATRLDFDFDVEEQNKGFGKPY